jgi:hypothetical protein
VGKRSRKRAAEPETAGTATHSTRAQRDAARQRRAEAQRRGQQPARPAARAGRPAPEDRPPAIWAPFPLTELVTLAGIVLMVWGFLSGVGRDGNARLGAGLAIASLAGLELAVREHVTGYRSHSSLLAGALAIAVIVALGLGAGIKTLGILLIAGAIAFVVALFALRALFRRRSGGLSFR